ncbi:MAG: hypothetical protein DRP79_04595 [Planctomycetota bacterium]|nr:MAG: hypothetical protein DRP79_04595 [Planctomycetota bacterium]
MKDGNWSLENKRRKVETPVSRDNLRYRKLRRRRRIERAVLIIGVVLALGVGVLVIILIGKVGSGSCYVLADWVGKEPGVVLASLGKPDTELDECLIKVGPIEQAAGRVICYRKKGVLVGLSDDGRSTTFVMCIDGRKLFADAGTSIIDKSDGDQEIFDCFEGRSDLMAKLGASRQEIVQIKGRPLLSIVALEDDRVAFTYHGTAASRKLVYVNDDPPDDMPKEIERNRLFKNATFAFEQEEPSYEMMVYPGLVLILLEGKVAVINFCANALKPDDSPDLIERAGKPMCEEFRLSDRCGVVFEKCAFVVKEGRIICRHSPNRDAPDLLRRMNWKRLATYEAENADSKMRRRPKLYILE